jgi:hypothetical protein
MTTIPRLTYRCPRWFSEAEIPGDLLPAARLCLLIITLLLELTLTWLSKSGTQPTQVPRD